MPHTPGPWRKGNYGAEVVSECNDGLTIGGANDEFARSHYGGYLIGESISPANVHLIAAAPDLLESIEMLINETSVGTWNCPAVEKVLAAIAKARGLT